MDASIITTINNILGKILPGTNPLIYLILAVIGGLFIKKWTIHNSKIETMLFILAAVATYWAIIIITKFLRI